MSLQIVTTKSKNEASAKCAMEHQVKFFIN